MTAASIPANRYWFIGGDGKKYLIRCPKCGLENYAPAVSAGVCAWCGYDANKSTDGKRDEPIKHPAV